MIRRLKKNAVTNKGREMVGKYGEHGKQKTKNIKMCKMRMQLSRKYYSEENCECNRKRTDGECNILKERHHDSKNS